MTDGIKSMTFATRDDPKDYLAWAALADAYEEEGIEELARWFRTISDFQAGKISLKEALKTTKLGENPESTLTMAFEKYQGVDCLMELAVAISDSMPQLLTWWRNSMGEPCETILEAEVYIGKIWEVWPNSPSARIAEMSNGSTFFYYGWTWDDIPPCDGTWLGNVEREDYVRSVVIVDKDRKRLEVPDNWSCRPVQLGKTPVPGLIAGDTFTPVRTYLQGVVSPNVYVVRRIKRAPDDE